MSETPVFTTAAALISFHKELVEGGIAEHVADDLVRGASHTLVIESGLAVRND